MFFRKGEVNENLPTILAILIMSGLVLATVAKIIPLTYQPTFEIQTQEKATELRTALVSADQSVISLKFLEFQKFYDLEIDGTNIMLTCSHPFCGKRYRATVSHTLQPGTLDANYPEKFLDSICVVKKPAGNIRICTIEEEKCCTLEG